MRILTCCQLLVFAVILSAPARADDAAAHYQRGIEYGLAAQRANIFSRPSLARKAKAEFERAVQIDPNFLDARFALLEYDLRAPAFLGGGHDKALAQANEIRKRDAFEGHRAFARIDEHLKHPELAHKEFVDAVKENPESAKAHYWLGISFLGQQNYAGASAEFEDAVRLDPGFMPAWFQIGHVSAVTGANLGRGEEALRKYLAYSPDTLDEPPLYRAHYWLGRILEKEGKRSDAKDSYAKSLQINPEQTDVVAALKRIS